jgi:hypothetical protein
MQEKMDRKRTNGVIAVTGILFTASLALAGRPLAIDDADPADLG